MHINQLAYNDGCQLDGWVTDRTFYFIIYLYAILTVRCMEIPIFQETIIANCLLIRFSRAGIPIIPIYLYNAKIVNFIFSIIYKKLNYVSIFV